MKIKIILSLCMTLAIAMVMSSMNVSVYAQKGKRKVQKTVDLTSQKGDAARGGNDENIKTGEMANDMNTKIPPPASKGGTSRGGSYDCEVQFDNYTDWRVKVYVDGVYKGTVGAWDSANTYVSPGSTSVYARADFNDGSFLYWGPKTYNCGPNQYIPFKIKP
jgi:hypothetical protein